MQDIDPAIVAMIDDHFWELIDMGQQQPLTAKEWRSLVDSLPYKEGDIVQINKGDSVWHGYKGKVIAIRNSTITPNETVIVVLPHATHGPPVLFPVSFNSRHVEPVNTP